MRKSTKKRMVLIWRILTSSILIISCRSTGEIVDTENKTSATVTLNMKKYKDELTDTQFSTLLHESASKVLNVDHKLAQIGEDGQRPKLIPLSSETEAALKNKTSLHSVSESVMQKQTLLLNPGSLLKVIVFDSNGDYVKDQIYTTDEKTEISITGLNEGKTYNFVAYTLNSPRDLPYVTYKDPAKKNTSNSLFTCIVSQKAPLFLF